MSACSIDAIDRPTESPCFRRTSSPTRAPIVPACRSPLRSAPFRSGLVATPPDRRRLALVFVLSHSSIHPSVVSARIQFSPRAFGVNFINLSGHRDYTAPTWLFLVRAPPDKWRRFCAQRSRQRLRRVKDDRNTPRAGVRAISRARSMRSSNNA